jgi:hypothetical protein
MRSIGLEMGPTSSLEAYCFQDAVGAEKQMEKHERYDADAKWAIIYDYVWSTSYRERYMYTLRN